jgi:tetratricopeptide (TPR) repeat protein
MPAPGPASPRAQVARLTEQAARLRHFGRPLEAARMINQALALQPGDADLLHSLGLALVAAGQPLPALNAFEAALRVKPHLAEAAWGQAMAREALGQPAAAEAALLRALELKPSLTGARFRLARLYEEWGRAEEATKAYRKVRSQASNQPLGRTAEARALLIEGRDDELWRVLTRAIAVDPRDGAAHELMGGLLSNRGRFAEAEASYERALAAAPDMAHVYYDLVRCRRQGADDAPLIERMRAAAGRPGLDSRVRAKLYLAIGKALDDLADYEGAMRAFNEAETLRRVTLVFDAARFETLIDRLIATFPAETIARAAAPGAPSLDDPAPVFIVGLPRSGTTLCEQVIAAHPRVFGADELTFWPKRAAGLEQDWSAAGDAGYVGAAARDYLALLRELAPDAERVTDKMPFNYLWLGLIHLALPRATLVHCRRDLADTAVSIHQTHFADRIFMPTGGEDLVAYCRGYERLMAHWRAVLPRERFVEVAYEQLTAAPEPEARRLIAVAGLDWDPACLRPEANERVVRTPSKWQARQPINGGSIGRWRRYAPWLGPLAVLAPEEP